jgi:hypothetical protein
MDEITQRADRAAESILENERLTADLDDAAAQVLLDWGVTCARMIARDTTGLDEVAAERAMSPRLRAIRRLMRQVNLWVIRGQVMDAQGRSDLLHRMVGRAAVIYGPDFTPPNERQREMFLMRYLEFADDHPLVVANLRQLVENPGSVSA